MKRTLTAAFICIGATTVSFAADLPSTKAPDVHFTAPAPVLSPWYVHAGVIGVLFNSSAALSVGGVPLTPAGTRATNNVTGGVEVGYYIQDNISLSATAGVPPTTTLNGQGILSGTKLGTVTYGPAVLSLNYHYRGLGPMFQPYFGGGVNYTIIFGTHDDAVRRLRVQDAWGPVLQAGIESYLNEHWGVFVDAKKIFVSTKASGYVGPAPAHADITLDPWILMTGVTYRF